MRFTASGSLQWGRRPESAEGSAKSARRRKKRASFNGAADLSPRKASPSGRTTRRPTSTLQWGRRPESAEGTEAGVRSSAQSPLQWGRRPESAEGLRRRARGSEQHRLQWGRRPESAEGSSILETRSRGIRFNGAADLSPRKVARAQHAEPVALALQWGRRPESAEGRIMRSSTRRA